MLLLKSLHEKFFKLVIQMLHAAAMIIVSTMVEFVAELGMFSVENSAH